MVYDETNVGEVSFLSETLGIAIESGDLFSYRRPSKKTFPYYKSNPDVGNNDRELIYSTKWHRTIEDDPTVGIIGTTPSIKKNIPQTAVSTQGSNVSNVMPSISQIKDSRFILLGFGTVVVKVISKWRLH